MMKQTARSGFWEDTTKATYLIRPSVMGVDEMARPHVVIVGGGIGGLFAANA